jgi:hypothetical protein
MDPLVVLAWGTAALLIILFNDPNVPIYIELKLRRLLQVVYSKLLATRMGLSLAYTRRSFRNDWLGRQLRDRELRALMRNPAYQEFFDGSMGAKGGSKKEP